MSAKACIMKGLKIFALAALLLAGGLMAYAATQPDHYRIERAMVMEASADEIFPYLNDFRKGQEWSPWVELDPAAKFTYGGAGSGVGATYEWDGNKNMGAGRIAIVESVAGERVKLDMEFIRPMQGRDTVEYTLAPAEGGTQVTWAMYGPAPFFSRIMMLFCGPMMNRTFDKGLGNLKAIVEKT